MGMFDLKKKDQKPEAEAHEEHPHKPVNLSTLVLIRVIAVGYVLWLLKDLVVAYVKGGENAPSIGVLLVAAVIFIGGSVWIGIMTVRQYKQIKAEQVAEAERIAAEEEALEAAKAAEEALALEAHEEDELAEEPEEKEE